MVHPLFRSAWLASQQPWLWIGGCLLGLAACGGSDPEVGDGIPTPAEKSSLPVADAAQDWETTLLVPLQAALAERRQGALRDLFLSDSQHRFPIAGAGRSVRVAGLDLRLIEAQDNSDLDAENIVRQWLAYLAGWSGERRAHWLVLDPPRSLDRDRIEVRLLARFAGRHANGSLQSLRLEFDLRLRATSDTGWRIDSVRVLRGMQGIASEARYRSIGPWVGFTSALSSTNRAGLAHTDQQGALSWAGLTVVDWNQDGFPDLLWTRHGQHTELFRNDGSSGFVPETLPLRVPQESPGSLLSVDLDNDGRAEWVGSRFLRFEGDQGFLGLYTRGAGGLWRLEERALALPVGAGERHAVVRSVTPVDIDLDGRLDLVFAMGGEGQRWNLETQRPILDARPRGQRNFLLRNVGGLRFLEAGETLGLTGSASTSQFAALDWNGDGVQDLYEANRAPWEDRLWIGGPGGSFAEPIGWFDAAQSPRLLLGDHLGASPWYDPEDRRPSLLVWGHESDAEEPGNLWLRSRAAGPAERLEAVRGLRFAGQARGAVPLDVGNRGRHDLLVYGAAGEGPTASVFVDAGRGEGAREEVAHLLGLGDLPALRAGVACDVDGDGDQDLVFATESGELLLMSDVGPSESSVRIALSPERSTAWGATVDVTAGGRTQRRLLAPIQGPSSQMEEALHFGLGSATRIERIRVRWPQGDEEVWEDLATDTHLRLVQGKARARSAPPLRWSQAPPHERALPQIGGYARLLDGRNHPLGETGQVNIVHLVAQAQPHRPLPWNTTAWPHAEELEVSLMVMDSDGWVPASDAPFQAYSLDHATLEEFVGEALEPRLPATLVFAPDGSLVRAFPLPPSETDLRAVVELARAEKGYPEVMVRNGFEALEQRRYDDALRWFGGAIESDASRLDAYLGLAHTHRYLGQIDAAVLAVFNATRVDPDFGLAHRLLGALQLSRGQGAEAMQSFRRVLDLEGDSVRTWFAMYEAATQAEDWQAGLAAIDETLAILQPEDGSAMRADALCARGKLLERLGKDREALAAYRQALAIDSGHPEALHRERTLAPRLR